MKKKKFDIAVKIIRASLLIALALAIYRLNWITLLISIATLGLTYFPHWFEHKYKIKIPLDFEFAIIFFVYAALFLGEVQNFYNLFWWWNILMHAASAVALGFVGFVIMYVINGANIIKTKPIWITFFAFCFAVSIGAIWEIFEFAMDQVFGINMQKTGLIDTMWDLIVDCLGALLAVLAGYFFLKGDQKSYLSKLMNLFIKDNINVKN